MSLDQIKTQIDTIAKSAGFRCVPVSWEDANRGTVGGALSCWGGNISDVRLWEKSGKLLYTVRSDNWNERLGYVAAKDVAVVVGNHIPGGSELKNVTLQNYLSDAKQYGGYAGLTSESLSENQTDQIFSIRFQTVFLPVQGDESANVDDIPPEQLGRVEFCTDVYNYNTHSDENPRNALLLCTAQGTSFQQDGAGTKKIFIHEVDPSGKIHRYWLEAERSKHKVGGAQTETKEEAEAAAARGKAVATFIGTRAMGTRFNVQMLIQLPLKQVRPPVAKSSKMRGGGGVMFGGGGRGAKGGRGGGAAGRGGIDLKMKKCKLASKKIMTEKASCESDDDEDDGDSDSASSSDDDEPITKRKRCLSAPVRPKVGLANAARVSRGTEEDTWSGLNKSDIQRDASQHGTITVTMYYTVVGGIPSEADVLAAVSDLNSLYKSCSSDKKLVDCAEVTSELTVKNKQDVVTKVTTQGYQPPVKKVAGSSKLSFPDSD